MTTRMQMYISYLHSRFQQRVLIIHKYMGHHGFVSYKLKPCRFSAGDFISSQTFSKYQNPSQEIPQMYFEL